MGDKDSICNLQLSTEKLLGCLGNLNEIWLMSTLIPPDVLPSLLSLDYDIWQMSTFMLTLESFYFFYYYNSDSSSEVWREMIKL